MEPTENFMEISDDKVRDMLRIIPLGVPVDLDDLMEIYTQDGI